MEPRPNPEPREERPPESVAFSGTARARRRGPAAAIVAGIALVVVAVVAAQVAPADGPSPRASAPAQVPSAAPSDTDPITTPTVEPAPTLDPVPSRRPDVTPIPAPPAVAIDAGPVTLTVAGASAVEVELTVPDGWSRVGPSMVALLGDDTVATASLSAWAIDEVLAFPCRWASGAIVDPTLLATPAGQAEALSAWWGQVPGSPPNTNAPIAPIATRPAAGSIAGRDAWSVEILVRREFDFTACDGGQLVLWRTADGAARTTTERGELLRLWTLDIDGQVVVIDATASTSASPADLAALEAVLASMSFAP